MYTVVVVSLPEFAVWLVAGLVVEALAIGILAYLVLRISCVVSMLERVQNNHEQGIEALWRVHEPGTEKKEGVKNE